MLDVEEITLPYFTKYMKLFCLLKRLYGCIVDIIYHTVVSVMAACCETLSTMKLIGAQLSNGLYW